MPIFRNRTTRYGCTITECVCGMGGGGSGGGGGGGSGVPCELKRY